MLPADIDLVAVPSDWGPGLNRYRYVYWNDRVVLVEPGNRRIVHVIDLPHDDPLDMSSNERPPHSGGGVARAGNTSTAVAAPILIRKKWWAH